MGGDPHDPLGRTNVSSEESTVPPGVQVDFNSTLDHQQYFYIVAGVFLPITTAVLVLRLYAKFSKRRPGWEDYMVIVAYVFYVVNFIAMIKMGQHGLARIGWDLNELENSYARFWGWVDNFYYCCVFFSKLSILILYHRVFQMTGWTRATIWIIGLLTFAACMIGFFGNSFGCKSPVYFWQLYSHPGECFEVRFYNYFNVTATAVNLFTDLVMIALPVRKVWELSLPRAQKWALSVVFCFALLATLFGALRMMSYYNFSSISLYVWKNGGAYYYGTIEISLYIICGSAPLLRAPTFVQRVFFTPSPAHPSSEPKDSAGVVIWKPNAQQHAGSGSGASSFFRYLKQHIWPFSRHQSSDQNREITKWDTPSRGLPTPSASRPEFSQLDAIQRPDPAATENGDSPRSSPAEHQSQWAGLDQPIGVQVDVQMESESNEGAGKLGRIAEVTGPDKAHVDEKKIANAV